MTGFIEGQRVSILRASCDDPRHCTGFRCPGMDGIVVEGPRIGGKRPVTVRMVDGECQFYEKDLEPYAEHL